MTRLGLGQLGLLPLLLAVCAGALAEDPSAPPAGGLSSTAFPSDAELEARGAVIGEVRIRVGEIFDPREPGESSFAYRLVNRLHYATRREVVAQQLLFHSGEPYSHRLLEESERLLRADRYLGDVTIRPVGYDGQAVDLEVATHDVWTLNLGFSVGRAGGASSTRFQLQDTNFLGTGKGLTLERSSDVDRDAYQISYDDPALLGSRFLLGLSFADTSDGSRYGFALQRPFYALDSHWALGLRTTSEERIDTVYQLGEITDRFGHQATYFELWGGLSRGLVDGGAVGRWTAGFTYQQDRFDATAGGTGPPPPDRTLAYPWIAYDWQRDDFRKTQNLDRMGRTEDVVLGPHLRTRLGLSSPAFGGDRNELVFDGSATLGRAPGHRQLLFLDAGLSGRWQAERLANALLLAGSRYYLRDFGDNELYVGLEAAAAEHLDPERQLLLGGDNGLRGYPLRYQQGTARALLTLEQRVFTRWYPLRLLRVGGAVFYDAGRVWGGPPETDLGWLQDVGLGLRLVPTRSGRASVVHVDLALPLDGPSDIARVQWLVTTKTSF